MCGNSRIDRRRCFLVDSLNETRGICNVCSQGKEWVNEVRKCLMKAVAPFYKGAHDCDTIKRIAFESHVGCYLKSSVGFCNMAQDTSNWDALWAVYEVNDFVGPDAAAAWKQVTATGRYV